jgi:hypothetical protein
MDSLKNRKQFKFYRSYFDIISELENDTDKLKYLLSILEFQFNGIEIPLQGMAKFAFKSQKHSLDRQLKGFIDATSSNENIETPESTPLYTPLGGANSNPIMHTPLAIINNKEEIINKEKQTVKNKIESTCLTFDEFWNMYGKKVDSKKCKDKFETIKESDRKKILDTLELYVKSKPEVKFRKDPIRYLTGEIWNDEIIESKPIFADPKIESFYNSSLAMIRRGERTHKEHNEVVKNNKYDSKYLLPE